jgi:hypothetical protein
MAMDVKIEQRAVIEFLFLEGFDGEEIDQYLQNVYVNKGHFRATVLQWVKEIRNSNEEFRHERPGGRYQYEIDSQIQDILRDDPFTLLRTIADILNISLETVYIHLF